jgi:RNA polymerase sigma-70 factor (ECF subfamily)
MKRTEFNDLVLQYSRNLYGYAYRILRNQEEAEDAIQEVFIKLWNMGNKIDSYNSLEALAVTMTKNFCIDQIRKRKQFIRDDEVKQDQYSVDNSSPFELLNSKESEDILHQIIDQLPEIYNIAIRLKEIEGLSYEEIAARTDQNINTLRVTLSRARKMIREEFNKFQYERRGFKKAD